MMDALASFVPSVGSSREIRDVRDVAGGRLSGLVNHSVFRVVVWRGSANYPVYSVQRLSLYPDCAHARSEMPEGSSLIELQEELVLYLSALNRPWLHMDAVPLQWLPARVVRFRELELDVAASGVHHYRVGHDAVTGKYAVYRALESGVVGPWDVVARSEDELMTEMARYCAAVDAPVIDVGGVRRG